MERDVLDVGFTSFAFSTDGRFPNLVASPKNSSFLLSGLRAEALKGRFNTLITYLKLVIQLCQLWMGTTKQDIFLSTQTLPAPQRKTSTG